MGQPLVANYTGDINEQWRDSAAFVLDAKGCESAAIRQDSDPTLHFIATRRNFTTAGFAFSRRADAVCENFRQPVESARSRASSESKGAPIVAPDRSGRVR
jgi:hypothetical protein